MIFIGVDLGWYGKPSGLASVALEGSGLQLLKTDRLESPGEILDWIAAEVGEGPAVAAVDAPLVIANRTGIRQAERELNRDFRRYHAGCHAANLGRPFAAYVTKFSEQLKALGFLHGVNLRPKEPGRFQIEVHPHAAMVSLFGLERIVKYKRGVRASRAKELQRLRQLMLEELPRQEPSLALRLPDVPEKGALKPAEDRIDAALCAFVAAYWWWWGTGRNTLYGDAEGGYIVTPTRSEWPLAGEAGLPGEREASRQINPPRPDRG